jgi:hypothetical protein
MVSLRSLRADAALRGAKAYDAGILGAQIPADNVSQPIHACGELNDTGVSQHASH